MRIDIRRGRVFAYSRLFPLGVEYDDDGPARAEGEEEKGHQEGHGSPTPFRAFRKLASRTTGVHHAFKPHSPAKNNGSDGIPEPESSLELAAVSPHPAKTFQKANSY